MLSEKRLKEIEDDATSLEGSKDIYEVRIQRAFQELIAEIRRLKNHNESPRVKKLEDAIKVAITKLSAGYVQDVERRLWEALGRENEGDESV